MDYWTISTALRGGVLIFASLPLLAQPTPSEPPPGEGLELIQRSCINCHDISIITAKRKTRDEWAQILGVMADRGAEVTPDEMQIIEEYLSRNFSDGATRPMAAH
jgi:hypothetical protein